MSEALDAIKPTSHQRVMDLVQDAGVNVSDWSNCKGGAAKAAANPKYCYEWAFIEPNKLVVLNLWFAEMREEAGVIYQRQNHRELSHKFGRLPGKGTWSARAARMDLAVQNAVRNELAVRVIVCDGDMRDIAEPDSEASKVERRLLDPIPWAVTSYDRDTGDCELTRGAPATRYVDQFSTDEFEGNKTTRAATGEVWVRDQEVRRRVLLRAMGRCELCGEDGFLTHDGRVFLETHHIVPLSEGGPDSTTNVVALCPNHHREAHYGKRGKELREILLAKIS